MEYQNLLRLKEKFVTKDDEVILTDPIEKYNYFIKNYNVDYNVVNSTHLKIIPFQSFYSICYIIQNRILNLFILFVVIPAVLLVAREYLDLKQFHLNFIIRIYYLVLILSCSAVLIIYFNAKRIYKENSKKIANPFKNMVFHPDICRNIINKHIELCIEELKTLNLSENKLNELTQTADKNKVRFMLYGDEFVNCYSDMMNTKIVIKHMIWWSSAIINFILIKYIFL